MKRVVLDTNVLISAIVFGGKPRTVLDLAIRGKFVLLLSPSILDEVEEVLLGKKFHYSPAIVREVVHQLAQVAEDVQPETVLDVVKRDPEDNRILECALDGNADVVVSGDVDLLSLREFRGIKIMAPDEFLTMFRR